MNNKITAWLAWTLCGVVIAGAAFNFVLTWNDPKVHADVFTLANGLTSALFPIAYGVVGALILSRAARNRIGWLLMTIALAIALLGALQSYYAQTTNGAAELTALKILVIWLSGWGWWLLIGPLLLLLLLFPTGRLLSPRWRWVVGMIVLLCGFWIVFITASPEWQDPTTGQTFPNPLGLNVIPADLTFDTIQVPWMIALVSAVGLCVLSVVVRYRRSGIIEREQLKWFLYACAIFIATYAFAGFFFLGEDPPAWNGLIFNAILMFLPASIGIAILRYHLFDIDIIIRRTVTYSILTALLALIYFGGVVLAQQLTRSITASSDLAIAVSTLVIAALFFPLRRRVRNAIDKRFYRRKYDAARTLAAFSATVRDEVELEKLTAELLNVVQETMQPASVSLWLNTERGRQKDETSRGFRPSAL
jgi:MFS family permease